MAGKLKIAIIGAGKVGTTLGKILAEEGERVACIVSRTLRSARAAGKFIGCRTVTTSLEKIPADVNLIMITTPHGAVRDVARSLARLERPFRRVAVCHASGMLTADALDPLRNAGATVFSFHPLQTFPREFPPADIVPNARGITYGVDGTAAALRTARMLAAKLRGRVFPVPPEMREFYHAACVVASNHLTALFGILSLMVNRMAPRGKDSLGVFFPIIMATIANVRMSSPEEALTGPIARGGVETVARHLAAIEEFAPELVPFYAMMSLETTRLARRKGSITAAQADDLERLIRSSLPPSPEPKEPL